MNEKDDLNFYCELCGNPHQGRGFVGKMPEDGELRSLAFCSFCKTKTWGNLKKQTAGSQVSVKKSTRQKVGSCFDCEAHMGEDYPVFQIIIHVPSGINNELRYCSDHLPGLFAGFIETLAPVILQLHE